MVDNLFALAEQNIAAGLTAGSALPEALRISSVALLAIFFVMGLFGGLITLLSLVFPDTSDEAE